MGLNIGARSIVQPLRSLLPSPEVCVSPTVRDAPSSLQPGQVLGGKFRIERVLGEGGMGVVVAATHLGLGQLVAIKLMLPEALAHPENVERFEREARAAVRLKSEHVARVSDVGRLDDGSPYIVMEYLHGEDLDQVLEKGGVLPIETAVDYVLQACEAVAEAHALGIVHRDLKPKNLFLTTRVSGKPLVKVLDFGISKSTVEGDMSLTSTAQIMGSPNYMSPEQLRSARNVDLRTDIWALGAILYELLSGYVPFVAESVTELTAMVLQDLPRPLTELRPDVPPALVAAITKCLEKPREARFQSVSELAMAIAPFASSEGVTKANEILSTSGGFSQPRLTAPPEPTSVRLVGPGASTNSAWDRTQLANTAQRRAPIAIGVAIALIAVVGVAGFEAFRHGGTAPVATVVAASGVAPSVAMAPPPPPPPPPPSTSVAVAAVSAPLPTTTALVTHPTAVVRTKPDAGVAATATVVAPPPVVDAGPAPSVSGKLQPPNVRN